MPYSYDQLRRSSFLLAEKSATPRFYRDLRGELEDSRALESAFPVITLARKTIADSGDSLGHGLYHAEKVAIEAGAIVRREMQPGPERDRLSALAVAAGYLHDIRRSEKSHPEKGANEARLVLDGRMDPSDIEIVAFAIRNHEAFREPEAAESPAALLVSSALYDADKFRWGADNFVHTLWDMAQSMGATPGMILLHFDRGISSIRKIRGTFRTDTGRMYGPEFIDIGLALSEEIRCMLRECSSAE
ncbi:MAG TPA: hypothetical protein PK573_02360 [Spirochaetota bacterium]|nr:hypothetical protein [Spirochaetota bacterium]HRZ26534.1 hypothetical protein [Spirochaetota bacterium]HSA13928.1 hypothetical protein [Spirochaetota bacterium]